MTTIPSSRVVCRTVGVNRIDDLVKLEETCFETDRIVRRNLRRLLHSPSAECIAAFKSGTLIGSMIVLFRKRTTVARIYSLAVAPEARGQGIGQKMMEKAESLAKEHDCRTLRLEVRMDNMDAIRLYNRCGFTDTAVIPGYYEDGAHAFVLQKVLD